MWKENRGIYVTSSNAKTIGIGHASTINLGEKENMIEAREVKIDT